MLFESRELFISRQTAKEKKKNQIKWSKALQKKSCKSLNLCACPQLTSVVFGSMQPFDKFQVISSMVSCTCLSNTVPGQAPEVVYQY